MFRSDVGWKMALALVVPAMATDGHVKVLLETDGVELHGRSCSTNGSSGACACSRCNLTHAEGRSEGNPRYPNLTSPAHSRMCNHCTQPLT